MVLRCRLPFLLVFRRQYRLSWLLPGDLLSCYIRKVCRFRFWSDIDGLGRFLAVQSKAQVCNRLITLALVAFGWG
jgi:hypothetical protein